MLKIAVCDDDNGELSHITALLEQYQAQKHIAARIELFHNAMELMEALCSTNYQLLLLDILMPGFTGIQAARELRTFDSETKIIFLTSSPEFAVESYRVDAFYYLLKPIKGSDLFPVLDRLLLQLHRAGDTLLLAMPSGLVRLPYSDIEVLEVNSKRLLFYLTDGSVREIPGTLTQYEPQLGKCCRVCGTGIDAGGGGGLYPAHRTAVFPAAALFCKACPQCNDLLREVAAAVRQPPGGVLFI